MTSKRRSKNSDSTEISVVATLASGEWWDIKRKTQKSTSLTEDALRQVYEEQVRQFEATLEQDSEQRWLKKVAQSGTAADMAAAHKVTAQMCPPLSLKPLKSLVVMASRKGRSEALLALDVLQMLFIEHLIPRNRKLAALDLTKAPPAADCVVSQVLCYFEDSLKLLYAGYVDLLVQRCSDNVLFMKTKCLKYLAVLLAELPEQEVCILQALVNKLGDKSKVASTVSHSLLQVLTKHPGMKGVMVREVTQLMRRNEVSQHAKYMSTLLLSEIPWNRKNNADQKACQEVCRFLADFLDRVFSTKNGGKKAVIKEEDNRLIRACITGMSRALGACGDDYVVPAPLIDCLFRVCHTVPAFATRIAILCLLYRVVSRSQLSECSDRFFRLLYTQLMCVDLFSAKNDNLVFCLVRKVLAEDHDHIRCLAMARRLMQLCALQGEPGAAFGALWAFSDFMLAKKTELRRVLKAESDNDLIDEAEEYFDDGAEQTVNEKKHLKGYDPSVNCRDPKFARPHEARMWELYALRNHLHPQVNTNAKKLMEMDTFIFSDDPFEKYGVSKFLDFMNLVNQNSAKSAEYRDMKKRVAPEEEFHAQYFRDEKIMAKRRKLDKKKAVDVDDVDVADGQDAIDADAFFQKYLEGQVPKDVDDDLDDLEAVDDLDEGSSDADGDVDDMEGMENNDDGASAASDEKPKVDLSNFASLPPKEKKLRQKQIFKQFSSFASADDFAHLLAEET
eukprot:GEMP01026568.1.p1 GENE.GEMP01026568.1~~GEMP01026568.1.p1  ORF type:complete len:731 (+),score=186.56 GEMP01026568.1:127-2319(+)